VGGMWWAVSKGIGFWYSSTFNPQHMKPCDENIWMYANTRRKCVQVTFRSRSVIRHMKATQIHA
jgi:hypothetical protein